MSAAENPYRFSGEALVRQKELTDRIPQIAGAVLAQVPADTVLDGNSSSGTSTAWTSTCSNGTWSTGGLSR